MNAPKYFPGRDACAKLLSHRYGLSLGIYLAAGTLTGAACVLFMRAFEFVQRHQLSFSSLGAWWWLAAPALFLAAVGLIRRFAPFAEGAGIPQTVFAANHINPSNCGQIRPLLSFRTMTVKIAALLIGLWAGASTGREGPTVHVAACLFFGIAYGLHRLFRLSFDMRSAVIAGAAAGLAAAFNTPMAGVTFAIEELSGDYFSSIKDFVLMTIVVAGLTAKSLTGEYAYFGRLHHAGAVPVLSMLLVGVLAGGAGALFSLLLVRGRRAVAAMAGWKRPAAVVALATGVLALVFFLRLPGITGPGNLVAQGYVHGQFQAPPASFAVSKAAATLFTYWSGIAGGIFAPCLSIGSAIGVWLASWQGASVSVCAAMGMAAFLAGTIQAPITAFVIIYEMTGQHHTLLPIMLASLLGYMTARSSGAPHLYKTLASSFDVVLK